MVTQKTLDNSINSGGEKEEKKPSYIHTLFKLYSRTIVMKTALNWQKRSHEWIRTQI